MGVATMNTDNKIIVDNAMKWIKRLLEKNYHLKACDADWAINKSGIKEIYGYNVEMSSHDSIEEWTKTVYNYYKINKSQKEKDTDN